MTTTHFRNGVSNQTPGNPLFEFPYLDPTKYTIDPTATVAPTATIQDTSQALTSGLSLLLKLAQEVQPKH